MQTDYRELNKLFGNVDIYLLDQILKGVFLPGSKILDAGSADGRNLIYFLRNDFDVYAIDRNEESVQMLRHIVRSIKKSYPTAERVVVGDVTAMPFLQDQFDAVISSAVLHFAENEEHFLSMFQEHTRVLKHGGIFFIRMAADVGIEDQIKSLGNGRYLIPDGSERFLLTKTLLRQIIRQFGYQFLEPFKTVIVEDMRSMSTIVLRKTTSKDIEIDEGVNAF